jgi:hypothetical protein
MRIINVTRFGSSRRLAFYSCLCALLLLQGCSQKANDVTQFGSHKITVSRHDLIHGAAYMEEHDKEASFHYKGFSLSAGQFKVVIKDEKVTVNGQDYGQLNSGDSVSITDDGVRVNSMDYGETARYLRTNSEQARR